MTIYVSTDECEHWSPAWESLLTTVRARKSSLLPDIAVVRIPVTVKVDPSLFLQIVIK